MTSLDGISDLRMSGARATFQVDDADEFDEAAISDAFAKVGMKLERFERIERPRAKSTVLVDAGVT